MNFEIASCAALTAGLTLLASVARAQPVFATYESLELRVARAQTIVRGTVSKSTGVFIERRGGYFGGYREDGRARPDGVMRYTITVKVDEVLKGKPARTIELVEETIADDKRFAQWAEHHTSFLWFDEGDALKSRTWSNLQGTDAQSNKWNTIRLGEPVPAESGWTSDSPVFTQDFTHVTDPKDILARVRNLARNRSETLQVHTFKSIWPPDPAHLWASLSVPVNASLEKLARRMIQSPDVSMPTKSAWKPTNAEERVAFQNGIEASRNASRVEGINALRYFKSSQNIKLVQPFLASPAFSATEHPDGSAACEYDVRKAAFDTLSHWDVDVLRPVLEEELPPPTPKTRLKLVSVDSQETEGESDRGENAVDGNPATLWHTEWQARSPGLPHEIVIELIPPIVIKGFTYLPRQDASDHGAIKDYEFYVSNDGDNFGRPLQTGAFETGKGKLSSTFEPVKCRFIKLRAISEINGLAWTSVAEIGVIEAGEDSPDPALPMARLPIRDEITPLHSALAHLTTLVSELSDGASIVPGGPYGSNAVTGFYTTSGGSKLEIIAKSYDSPAAAEAGQELDSRMVSVSHDHTENIQGVTLYEFRRYGGLYFRTGPYTFRLQTAPRANENVQPLLLKISSALINEAYYGLNLPAAAPIRK